jgi:hypothetical protein
MATNRIQRAHLSAEGDGLWPIAMLRIAMELRRPEAPSLEEAIADVAARMGIERGPFERYLAAHLGGMTSASA